MNDGRCQENECQKKAKIICRCKNILLCLKHSIEHQGNKDHQLEYLTIEINRENVELLNGKLKELVFTINKTLANAKFLTKNIIERIYEDYSAFTGKLVKIQNEYIGIMRTLESLKKVQRNSDNYFYNLLMKRPFEVKEIMEN